MAETVVVVVDSLDRDPVEGCLGEPGVGVYASNDRAIALDGSGLAAAGFEVVDVGGEKFADRVASGRPVFPASLPAIASSLRLCVLCGLPEAASRSSSLVSRSFLAPGLGSAR